MTKMFVACLFVMFSKQTLLKIFFDFNDEEIIVYDVVFISLLAQPEE